MEEDKKLDGQHAIEEAMSMCFFSVRLVSGSSEYVSPSFDAELSQVPEGCVNI